MVLPVTGGSDEGGRDHSDSDLNPSEAEYGRAIYCNASDYETVKKGHQAARRADSPAAVGTEGD